MADKKYVYMPTYRFDLRPEEKAGVTALFNFIGDDELESDETLASKVEGIILPAKPEAVARARRWIPRFPRLKAISSIAAGYDHTYAQVKEFGIPFANCPDAHTEATADHAMALLLAAGCGLLPGVRNTVLADRPHDLPVDYRSSGVSESTIGIVGLGHIGSAIARRAQSFNMRVLYYSRRRRSADEERAAGSSSYCGSLEELLPRCDYVVAACSLNEQTSGMFSRPQFELMKRGATFVNISRGKVVDTEALVEALRSGQIRQAALDVTDPEPLPPGHPLLGLDNVIVTPHMAAVTSRGLIKCMSVATENLKAALIEEKTMPNAING